MAYMFPSEGSLDYFPCLYGDSRVQFRGPKRDIGGAYAALIGGAETYGKFATRPFADLLEHQLGLPVVNFGCANAGPDLYLNESSITDIAGKARVTVVQILGAVNISNCYYRVHPRRNDRFLGETAALRAIFPQVDFTEFHFTRHMMLALQRSSRDRFEVVAEELRSAWVVRMRALLSRLRNPTILLWLADHPPPEPEHRVDLAKNPLLVDSEMIAALHGKATSYLELVYAPAQKASASPFAPIEAIAAASLPGAAAHRQVAEYLAPILRSMI